MTIKLPSRIIELFGRFRQLNSILNENWRDVASKDFFSNFIDPVNVGWKTFRRQSEEASQMIKKLNSSAESSEFQLRKFIDGLSSDLMNSSLRGYTHCIIHGENGNIDILMPPWENAMNEDSRREYAMMYDPSIDEDTRVESKGLLSI